ncbi:MAG: cryptochrome/photolyase family protein [Candidatus Dependentiae bacterium]
MSNEAILILPTQLLEQHPLLEKKKETVFLVEFERYFSDFNFHKQKIIFHRATMQMYKDFLKKNGHMVVYIEHHNSKEFEKQIKAKKIDILHCLDPVDTPFEKVLKARCKKIKTALEFYETPLFLTPTDWIKKYFKNKKNFRQQGFYQAQRKRLNILMTQKGNPIGGKWSFDAENRKPLPDSIKIPIFYKPRTNKYQKEAINYVQKHFKNNYGNAETFFYPTTYPTAKKAFDDFLEKRFAQFGPYQDAIVQNELVLFHSVLSPLLNVGLLTPQDILEKTLAYAKKNKVPINSLEGFIRQLIGWREYVRAVYILEGQEQRKSNFFEHKRKMPKSFWDAKTKIPPVDDAINQALNYAYNHHILRLMVLGNFMLLCEINPNDIYRWFMEFFIDSYDWVMVPNVYGMSQYADGGSMTTKPYISGSNYILKMSDYKKGKWCETWNALYWHFIYKKRNVIKKIPRLAIMYSYLQRIHTKKIQAYIKESDEFLAHL